MARTRGMWIAGSHLSLLDTEVSKPFGGFPAVSSSLPWECPLWLGVSLRSLESVILPMTVLSWEGTSGNGVIVPVGSFWAEVGKAVRGMGHLSLHIRGDTLRM